MSLKIGCIVTSNGKKYKVSEVIDGDAKPAISAHPMDGDFVFWRTIKYLGNDYDSKVLDGKHVKKSKIKKATLKWRMIRHRANPEEWPMERVHGGLWENKLKYTG